MRSVRRAPKFVARNMSAGKSEAELIAEGEKWKKISFGMTKVLSSMLNNLCCRYDWSYRIIWRLCLCYLSSRARKLLDALCWPEKQALPLVLLQL